MPAPINPELQAVIERGDDAYREANPAFFDIFADDATIYRLNSAEPFENLAAYRAFFEPQLVSTRRELTVVDRSGQEIDNSTVVLQTLRVVQNEVTVNVRQTVVWSKSNNTWKVRHLNSSLLGTPTGPQATDARSVRVINERIATVAAVMGVAQ